MPISSTPLHSPLFTLNTIEKNWQSGKYEQALTDLTKLLEEKSASQKKWKNTLDTTKDKHREWKADRLKSQIEGRAPSRELLEEIGDWVLATVKKLRKEVLPAPTDKDDATLGSKSSRSIWDTLGSLLGRAVGKKRSAPPLSPGGGFGESSLPPPSPRIPSRPSTTRPKPTSSLPPPKERMEEAAPPAAEISLPESSFSPYAYKYDSCDWVDVSLFSKNTVIPGKRFLVTAFAHLAEQTEEVERLIHEADPEAIRQGGKTLATAIERTTPIQFHLEIEDWGIDEPSQSVIWLGRPASAEFLVKVPGDARDEAFGRLIVISDKGPVGRISFNLTIGEGEQETEKPTLAVTEVKVYHNTYLAYDKKDHPAIEALEPHFSASGWKWSPEAPGPSEVDLDWEVKAIPAIKKSELFVLFWSDAAEASDRVETEWQVALGARLSDKDGLPDILAVNLQNPAPDVPERLSFLSFLPEFTAKLPPLPQILTFTEDNQTLKRLCDEYVSTGDKRVFDILSFKAKEEDQIEIIGLQNQFNTLRRAELLEEISSDDAKVQRSKINSSILSLVGRLF